MCLTNKKHQNDFKLADYSSLVEKLGRFRPHIRFLRKQMSQKSVSVKAAVADGTAVQTDQEASKEEAKVDTLKDTSIQTVLYLEA